ncbi:MAG: hypothetical protein QM714_04235 [Nocardioides sp.]|uniref:hypothetical protein n=1 Tax=Nocardioides sp. TaxID=35761 RepID=UPI0039E558A3
MLSTGALDARHQLDITCRVVEEAEAHHNIALHPRPEQQLVGVTVDEAEALSRPALARKPDHLGRAGLEGAKRPSAVVAGDVDHGAASQDVGVRLDERQMTQIEAIA